LVSVGADLQQMVVRPTVVARWLKLVSADGTSARAVNCVESG
jgi:hypothetical protein